MAYGVTKERGAQYGAESPAGTPHALTDELVTNGNVP